MIIYEVLLNAVTKSKDQSINSQHSKRQDIDKLTVWGENKMAKLLQLDKDQAFKILRQSVTYVKLKYVFLSVAKAASCCIAKSDGTKATRPTTLKKIEKQYVESR